MRNRRTKDTTSELSIKRDKEINSKFCKQCNVGVLRPHHENPYKYIKCNICGYTKDLGNIKK